MTNRADPASGAYPRALFDDGGRGAFNPMIRGPQVAYAPDDETAGAGFSVEDAAALLESQDDDEGDPAAGAAAAAEPAAGDPPAGEDPNSEGASSAPDDTAGEAENPAGEGEEGAAEEGAENPLDAPLYWKPEAKAKFAALDPELQAEILAQEGPREAAATKAKDEAAQTRAQADKEIAGVTRFAEELQSFLPQAVQTFRSRWGDNPDWVAYAQANGTEAMTLAKTQFEAERAQLQQVANAAKVADETAHVAYVQSEARALETIAPELADAKEGPARRSAVAKFLVDQKIPPAALRQISAVELSLAYDAMRWRQAQAKSSPSPAPKPAPAATRPLARGAASAGSADPKARAAQGARAHFMKSGSIDDAVALLNALE